MIRAQIQLTETQYAFLRKSAFEKRTSLSELVRQAVDAAFGKAAKKPPGKTPKKILKLAGRYRDAKTDVSENHDLHAFTKTK